MYNNYRPYDHESINPAAWPQYNLRRKTPRYKKPRGRGRAAVLVAACLIFSCVSGFAGGYAAKYFSIGYISSYDTQTPVIENTPFSSDTDTRVTDSAVSPVTIVAGSALDKSIPEVAAAVKDSVVEITTETVSTNGRLGQFVTEGAGSGVIISADGYVVTNNHVIADARGITVRLSGGAEYSAKLIGKDSKTDLALLKIDAPNLKPAVLGDFSKTTVGESAVAVGNPLGKLGGTVTSGIISALSREITIDNETMTLLQTDAAINPGNSGGGLFNLRGELIGIVNAKSSGSDIEGLGFAIPVSTVKIITYDLLNYGYVRGRADTGLALVEISDTFSAMRYRVSQPGLYIADSKHSSLKSGDMITAVNGNPINSLSEWNSAIDKLSVGDTASITVSRGGQSVTADIKLTEKTV